MDGTLSFKIKRCEATLLRPKVGCFGTWDYVLKKFTSRSFSSGFKLLSHLQLVTELLKHFYTKTSVWPFVIELKYLLHFIKVGFTSFPTGQFTTVAIVNAPDGKLTDPLNNGIVNGKVDCPINFETYEKKSVHEVWLENIRSLKIYECFKNSTP